MVSDASKKKEAQKKAAAVAKRGGKVSASAKAAAAVNGSSSSADNLANEVGALQISDQTCTGVLCSHPLSRDIRIDELTSLVNLKELDITNNQLHGKIPSFRSNVIVKSDGNVNIGKDNGPSPTPTTPSGNKPGSSPGIVPPTPQSANKKSSAGVIVGSVVGGVCAVFFAGFIVLCLYRAKHKRSGSAQGPKGL